MMEEKLCECLLGIIENHPTELTDNAFNQLKPVLKELLLSWKKVHEELTMWDNIE
jgi:hypothetical protein